MRAITGSAAGSSALTLNPSSSPCLKKLDAWQEAMTAVFRELHRVLKPGRPWSPSKSAKSARQNQAGGNRSSLRYRRRPGNLSSSSINDQKFTKTANCWGVDNNFKGTNTTASSCSGNSQS